MPAAKINEKMEAIRLRKNESLTNKEIAARVGASTASVSHWLRDYPRTDLERGVGGAGRHKPDTRRRLNAEYRARNRDSIREAGRKRRKAMKREVLERYGTECAHCGFSDPRALQIDHVDNSGAKERAELGGRHFAGQRFYQHLKKRGWPSGYQTLCANCNLIKYYETKAMNAQRRKAAAAR